MNAAKKLSKINNPKPSSAGAVSGSGCYDRLRHRPHQE